MTTAALPTLRRLFWGAIASGTAGLAQAAPAGAQGNPYCQYPYYNAYYCQYYSYYYPYDSIGGGYSYASPYGYYGYAPYDYYAYAPYPDYTYDYGWNAPWIGAGLGGWYGGYSRGHRWTRGDGRRWAGDRGWRGEHSRTGGRGGGDHAADLRQFFGNSGGPGGARAGGSEGSIGSSSSAGSDRGSDLRRFFRGGDGHR
jgi:hypothetical protein